MAPDRDNEADSVSEAADRATKRRLISRRQFLVGSGGGLAALALAGYAGYRWPRSATTAPATTTTTAPEPAASATQTFVTRPDLVPPRVKLTRFRGWQADGSPRFILLSPRNYIAGAPGQAGLMIMDRTGRLVWFQPLTSAAPFDLQAQSYRGRSVLTWWQGQVVDGYGVGAGQMANASYAHLGTVQAGASLKADLHELQLTPEGTALVTAYAEVPADLSSVGGPSKGKVLAGHAQEIDLATGKLVHDWDSLSHVSLDESYLAAPRTTGDGPYDYFHINSISLTPDGNLLVSSRNTWTLYKVDRTSGKVLWRLNGKRSDFKVAKEAQFYWQHHSRYHGQSQISVFDDGSYPAEEQQSRGLVLDVDTKAMTVGLQQAYVHPAGFLAANQGSVQVLDDGRVFVGWGNQPYFSEFAPDGTLLLDGEFPIGYHSYRAFCQDWKADPPGRPAVAAVSDPASGSVVYASWNGATDIDRWTVLTGKEATALEAVGSQAWSGFETEIAVNASGPYFAVVAEDVNGHELGRSPVTKT